MTAASQKRAYLPAPSPGHLSGELDGARVDQATGRVIIFECRVGSHLYGTARPGSDEDFRGVYLPAGGETDYPDDWDLSEKLSTGPRNAAGDTDRDYWAVGFFLRIATEGQSGAVEILFAPPSMVTLTTPLWERIRGVLLASVICRRAVTPFVGFAASQAHRATVKGDNLSILRQVLSWVETLPAADLNRAVKDVALLRAELGGTGTLTMTRGGNRDGEALLTLPTTPNPRGHAMIEIAGRRWDTGARVKLVRNSITRMIERYGTRSLAAEAAGYDWKSLSHAYRLAYEAEEMLATGRISLPMTGAPLRHVMAVKLGEPGQESVDHHAELLRLRERIEGELVQASPLPPLPDTQAVERLLAELAPQDSLQGRRVATERTWLVTGDHLTARGVKPGPELGRLLKEAREAETAGRITSQEEASAFLDRLLGGA